MRQAGTRHGFAIATFRRWCVMNGRRGIRWVLNGTLALALTALVAPPAAAQSTIFNIPTTDTVPPQKGYFEFDFLQQAPGPDGGGSFQVILPRFVAGVTPKLEVGANL